MGKKSLEPPSPSLLGTAPHISLRDQRLQLSHDLLRILLLKKALEKSLRGPAPHTQVSWARGQGRGPGAQSREEKSQQPGQNPTLLTSTTALPTVSSVSVACVCVCRGVPQPQHS